MTLGLQSALASNTHLQIIHIHMCGFGPYETAVIEIAQGLAANTSIQRVHWSIPRSGRTVAAARAIRDMVETNAVIEALLLKRTCHGPSGTENKPDKAEDVFVESIVKGLEMNRTITKFRLDGYNALSESNKERILGVIAKSPSIQRAYVEFNQNEGHRLELLLANNREKWIDRVTDTSTPRSDRVEVLLESIGLPCC